MEQRNALQDGQPVLPSAHAIDTARSSILTTLPDHGLGTERVKRHLTNDITSGLNRSSQSPNYYGFVTGGATPAAVFADNVVTEADQVVQVHLPKETISTDVEDRALSMLCELIDLHPHDWLHRTFTTGATASNCLGLACGREYVVQKAARRRGTEAGVASHGVFRAMRAAELEDIQILTTVPHSSLGKAASIVGLGRSCVVDVGQSQATHRFDLALLEKKLKKPGVASIVAISCAEVNTGRFATGGGVMQNIRTLCDKYGAWLHVDAAFGLLARVLPETMEYKSILDGVAELELADSITGDAHKLLNVPYDCGIFLSKHLKLGIDVFQNANAAYLNTASSETTASQDRTIPSPLNIGIENSRRFRALPVYASLIAYGREGYRDMLMRQIGLSRAVAKLVLESAEYDLLPRSQVDVSVEQRLSSIYIIVLFRAKDDAFNRDLTKRLNATRRLYVSGTQWEGQSATRFAVANWQVDVKQDLEIVKSVLEEVIR